MPQRDGCTDRHVVLRVIETVGLRQNDFILQQINRCRRYTFFSKALSKTNSSEQFESLDDTETKILCNECCLPKLTETLSC